MQNQPLAATNADPLADAIGAALRTLPVQRSAAAAAARLAALDRGTIAGSSSATPIARRQAAPTTVG